MYPYFPTATRDHFGRAHDGAGVVIAIIANRGA
jgi:hypothetical protein